MEEWTVVWIKTIFKKKDEHALSETEPYARLGAAGVSPKTMENYKEAAEKINGVKNKKIDDSQEEIRACPKCGEKMKEKKLTLHLFKWSFGSEKYEIGIKVKTKYCPAHTGIGEDLILKLEDVLTFGDDIMELTNEFNKINSKKESQRLIEKIHKEEDKYRIIKIN